MATVTNTDANLDGNTLVLEELPATITALHTFDRDPNAPFAVSAGSAVVPNLDADKLDGLEATAFYNLGDASLTIGDGDAEDTKLVFDGNAQDYYVGLDDSADDLVIGLGSAVGTTPAISVDENQDTRIWQDLQVDGPQVTLGDGAAEDTLLLFDGNAIDFHIGLDDSADILRIGSGASLGVNAAISVEDNLRVSFHAAIRLLNIITPSQLTSNTDNWAPTGHATANVIRASTDASRNLTGLSAGVDGRMVLLINIGAQNLVLIHDSTSTAANRFYCPGDANLTLNTNDACWLYYDNSSSRWRVIGV